MIDSLKVMQSIQDVFIGLKDAALSADNLLQYAIIICAFVIARVIYNILRKPALAKIDSTDIPRRPKQVLQNLTKQIFPFITLVFLFITETIASAEDISLQTTIINGFTNVLAAWIIIRICLQFIENNYIRNLFATTIWIIAALSIFGMLEQTTQALDSVGVHFGEFHLTALTVIKGVFAVFALLYLASMGSQFAERRILEISGLSRSSRVLIAKIVRIALITFAVLIAITSAGIDLSLFAVFSGAIGLGIGFGMQKVVSNLFSGLLLLTDKSIEPGDVLEMEGGTFGWVQHMGARYTEVVTRDNKSILIPNEDFITQRVVNWSHGNTLIRQEIKFGVHYKSNPHEVKELCERAAAAVERVVDDPSPKCWLVEFGDSSLNFSLRFWITDAQEGVTNIKGTVMMALWDTFEENGIEIPYPHREVYMHEPETKKAPPKKAALSKKKPA